MLVVPNYHFNGDCYNALKLYEKAFNGKITLLLRNQDANSLDMSIENMSDEEKNLVYHAEMTIGNQRFFFSDSEIKIPEGQKISILLIFDNPDEVKKAYDVLKTDCTIVYPLEERTYSRCFVSLIDKYGMRWELMTEDNN